MHRIAVLLTIIMLLSAARADGKDWFYYDYGGSQVHLALCDSVVTVSLDSTYQGGKVTPLTMMVPGLDPNYTPFPTDLGYWQYGVLPGYDIDTILADLRALDEVDYAAPTFQLTDDQVWHVYNELLVTFKESVSQAQIDAIMNDYQLEILRSPLEWLPSYTLKQTENSPDDVFDICAELFQSGMCYTAYPNIYGVPDVSSPPNDTYYDRQWYLEHDASFGGKTGADIDMEAAWEYAPGDNKTTIAIVDLGFDVDHEDIDPSRFYYAFDAGGEDLLRRIPDFDPRLPSEFYLPHPYLWHGTCCLGIIAATGNNAQGIAGIASNLRVMPIKVIDDDAYGSGETYAMGFQWAEYWGADVVMSAVNFPARVPDVTKAVEYGFSVHGTATIIAAGNDAKRPNEYASIPHVFAVGGTDQNDYLWERSNRGPGIDVVAPATVIATTDITGEDGYNDQSPDAELCDMPLEYYCNFGSAWPFHGTSAAAAEVAAIAGLVKSRSPHLTDAPERAEALYEVLRNSAESHINPSDPPGYDTLYGWGRVNAARALLAVVRGDANNDGVINVTDAVHLITWIFAGGEAPLPTLGTGDVNCDGQVNITDAVVIILYIFAGGSAPEICYIYNY